MSPRREDWIAVLDALQGGDRVALVKVTNVITGFLARYRAYEFRDSWDDLCQEVLIALIRSAQRGAIRDPRAFINYTGTITRNKLADWIRQSQRPGSPDAYGDPEGAEAMSRVDAPPDRADSDLLLDLQRALDELPEKERQAMEAIYLEGMSYEEAAQHLGMPFGTLKRMQTQGLKRLREKVPLRPPSP
jgi:RNA polymerase sigma-70 factor (ECF subfamily)